jgi:3-oxoacyl-[acyl-carrier-protein] synthase-1
MVAALGPDVLSNCAAARAGLVRSSVIEGFHARSAVDGAAEPIVGHQAMLFTRGFEGDARLIRLAQGALRDLLDQTPHIAWEAERAAFYVSLPDARRTDGGLDLIADEAARKARAAAMADRPAAADERVENEARAARILTRAAELARWPSETVFRFASVAGHTGGAEAVAAAMADLGARRATRAVVLAIESWFDEGTLEWLQTCGRLKCDGNPVGLQPGEAGVAIALGLPPLRPDGRAPLVLAAHFSSERRSFLSGASAAGQGLAEVVTALWAGGPAVPGAVPWILSDQNGETYRASDWGYALVRLRAQHEAFSDPVVSFPALSFGDLGSASALAAVCVAVRAWDRNAAPAPAAIILAASDDDRRAALLVSSGHAGEHR